MKIYILFLALIIVSCESKKSNPSEKTKINGAYETESIPNDQNGSLYIFSDDEINYFEKDLQEHYIHKATWKYFIKKNEIYTCMEYVDNCVKEEYDMQFEILSNKIIGNKHVVNLKSCCYDITLRKELYFH